MTVVLPLLFVALFAAILVGYQIWIYRSQPGDIPQIKARLEEREHRVTDIRRDGFEIGTRHTPAYRKYRAVVKSPLGGPDEVHVVGVQATLFSYPALKDYGGAPRHNDFAGTV